MFYRFISQRWKREHITGELALIRICRVTWVEADIELALSIYTVGYFMLIQCTLYLYYSINNLDTFSGNQGCSLGLERLGLEVVSRRFLERLCLVSVLMI